MQTFLPYANFQRSARCLDRARLGKQRVEVLQILRSLTGITQGWRNHPATRMWEGFEGSLSVYGMAICDEWMSRGYADTCREFIESLGSGKHHELPPWIGNRRFHRAHQSNLVRKSPEHYRKFFPRVPDDLPYVWPTHDI